MKPPGAYACANRLQSVCLQTSLFECPRSVFRRRTALELRDNLVHGIVLEQRPSQNYPTKNAKPGLFSHFHRDHQWICGVSCIPVTLDPRANTRSALNDTSLFWKKERSRIPRSAHLRVRARHGVSLHYEGGALGAVAAQHHPARERHRLGVAPGNGLELVRRGGALVASAK